MMWFLTTGTTTWPCSCIHSSAGPSTLPARGGSSSWITSSTPSCTPIMPARPWGSLIVFTCGNVKLVMGSDSQITCDGINATCPLLVNMKTFSRERYVSFQSPLSPQIHRAIDLLLITISHPFPLYSQMARAPLNRNGDHGHADISDVRRPPRQHVDVADETGWQNSADFVWKKCQMYMSCWRSDAIKLA